MKTPPSMVEELSKWNNGDGVDLETWVDTMGNYNFAVGYITLFWPKFVEFEHYILTSRFTPEQVRGFENNPNSTPMAVEWVINHVHISDIHLADENISVDKVVMLGEVMAEIYTAKLKWQFPDKPCIVEFIKPEDPEDLQEYQLSFWQKKHHIEA